MPPEKSALCICSLYGGSHAMGLPVDGLTSWHGDIVNWEVGQAPNRGPCK